MYGKDVSFRKELLSVVCLLGRIRTVLNGSVLMIALEVGNSELLHLPNLVTLATRQASIFDLVPLHFKMNAKNKFDIMFWLAWCDSTVTDI